MEEVSIRLSCRGGEAGGVTGRFPVGHTGRCLFGMAEGVPRVEVLSDRCDVGVEERPGMAGARATAAAMVAARYTMFQVKGEQLIMCKAGN
jgi:hypothetical protein